MGEKSWFIQVQVVCTCVFSFWDNYRCFLISSCVISSRYASCCFIRSSVMTATNSPTTSSPSWRVRTTIDISIRQDIGKPNSSPVTTSKPLIKWEKKIRCGYFCEYCKEKDVWRGGRTLCEGERRVSRGSCFVKGNAQLVEEVFCEGERGELVEVVLCEEKCRLVEMFVWGGLESPLKRHTRAS